MTCKRLRRTKIRRRFQPCGLSLARHAGPCAKLVPPCRSEPAPVVRSALASALAFVLFGLAGVPAAHSQSKPPNAVEPYGKGHGIVSAANPLAAQAGLKVLKAGGSAADAAVAMQAVLGLVEPQSSGPLGGSFMTYYDAKTHKLTSFMGR